MGKVLQLDVCSFPPPSLARLPGGNESRVAAGLAVLKRDGNPGTSAENLTKKVKRVHPFQSCS
jgi:hypothetical protein